MAAILRPGAFNGLYPAQPEPHHDHRGLRWPLRKRPPVDAFAEQLQLRQNSYLGSTREALLQGLPALRNQLYSHGLDEALLPPAFALCAALLARHHGFRLHDNQIAAARLMLDGHLAELATGEGKTLATALAALVAGLAGIPVHVVTANDYLVERDAASLTPVAAELGLSVAAIAATTPPQQRPALYAHNIVFVSAAQLAFDYLRDGQQLKRLRSDLHLRLRSQQQSPLALRGLCLALIDEADNVLLDEATTPLILAAQAGSLRSAADCAEAFRLMAVMQPLLHYRIDPATQHVELTDSGRAWLADQSLTLPPQWRQPGFRHEAVIQALTARDLLRRDRDYLVLDGQISLIDRLSGRLAEGRRWSAGLHSMLEYKENLADSGHQQTLARTTFQQFFRRYLRLGGTSATLTGDQPELLRSYGVSVTALPPHQPSQRQDQPLRLFSKLQAQRQAIVADVRQHHDAGRPVLLACNSVADSETLQLQLREAGLPAALLNAATLADEADIIARAGMSAAITVTTRLAGRGTDIQLEPLARASGGLHVLISMFNSSDRLDRQLAGRAARQGDPGSSARLLSLDDETLQAALGRDLYEAIMRRYPTEVPGWLARQLTGFARLRLERRGRRQRKDLLKREQQRARLLQGLQI